MKPPTSPAAPCPWEAATSVDLPPATAHAHFGGPIDDRIYRVTEIVGSSTEGIDQAIRHALERAQRTLRNLDWFEVTDIRGSLQAGQNPTTQVTMKVGFRLEEQ
jgi:flavin-binding protein dodecin